MQAYRTYVATVRSMSVQHPPLAALACEAAPAMVRRRMSQCYPGLDHYQQSSHLWRGGMQRGRHCTHAGPCQGRLRRQRRRQGHTSTMQARPAGPAPSAGQTTPPQRRPGSTAASAARWSTRPLTPGRRRTPAAKPAASRCCRPAATRACCCATRGRARPARQR